MSSPKEQSENPSKRNRARQSDAAVRPKASVNMDELRELISLLRENGLAELELENEGFRVRLRRDSAGGEGVRYVEALAPLAAPPVTAAAAPPPAAGPTHPGTQASSAASQDQDLHIISSPIVGTFYRSPSPTADAFVKIGTNVEAESVVCIIEAMKLMNEIQAEISGEVVKIYVENGQPVEYGQPLFGIRT